MARSGHDGYADGTATVDGDSADYRFAAVEVEDTAYGTLTVYAGRPLAAEQSAVSTALTSMLIGFPVLLVVVGGVTWLVTRRAAAGGGHPYSRWPPSPPPQGPGPPVPEPDTHDEVARLARDHERDARGPGGLGGPSAAVRRDAPHELRSPIASLRTQLSRRRPPGVARMWDGAVEDNCGCRSSPPICSCSPGWTRASSPRRRCRPGRPGPREPLAARRRPGCQADGTGPAHVAGSRGQLARVLGNLVDNAQRHARTAVDVTVGTDGGG
ncbi:hypothetical protein [Streptomyces sp. KL116D]|uniref:hypothetical protein n=1 Tax=Streptomyces sp. KL116D TaxID=3045152 RepID=UPI0035565123